MNLLRIGVVIGVLWAASFASAQVQGNLDNVAKKPASAVTGNCAEFDANDDPIDSGAPCGTGGATALVDDTANSLDNAVRVSVGTSGREQEETGVTIDPATDNISTPGTISAGSGSSPTNITGVTDDVAPGAPGSADQFIFYIDRIAQQACFHYTGEGSPQCHDTDVTGGGSGGNDRISVLAHGALPDTSSNVIPDISSQYTTNDRFPTEVWVFKDTGTKDCLRWKFQVPSDYSAGADFIPVWASGTTAFDVQWDLSYRAIGGDDTESIDQAGSQEDLTGSDNAGSAAWERLYPTALLDATDVNFAANDTVLGELCRDGVTEADTSDVAVLFDLLFLYTK